MALNPDIVSVQKYRVYTERNLAGKVYWVARPPYSVPRPFVSWEQAAFWLDGIHQNRKNWK